MSAPAGEAALDAALAAGARALGLPLSAEQRRVLLAYLALLDKWNAVYNLTAVRDPARMLTHHLLDSLAVVPFVQGPRLLDVGSGAGLPGLLVAIALPELHCVLLDVNRKKTRFLTQAAIELGLSNVEVITARAEAYRPDKGFSTVVSRAVGSLEHLLAITTHLCAPGGRMLAMKGVWPEAELEALAQRGVAAQVHRLEVPGLGAERRLIEIPCGPAGGAQRR